MKPLTIADSLTIVLELQDEIRRSGESRYDHRLHGVLLVAQGMTCPDVARLLGDAPRSVEYWVNRFERDGLAGLSEGERAGRPRRLDNRQRAAVDRVLRRSPQAAGLSGNLWDGKTLSTWIEQSHLWHYDWSAAVPADVSPAGLSSTQTPASVGSGESRSAEGP
jgi:transposase